MTACLCRAPRCASRLRPAKHARMAPAITQRMKFSVIGGTCPAASRPTMALPAQLSGGNVSKKSVPHRDGGVWRLSRPMAVIMPD